MTNAINWESWIEDQSLFEQLDRADNCRITHETRAASVVEGLAKLLAAAGSAQQDATRSITEAHLAAGKAAGDYLAAAMAGITTNHASASAAYIDQLIDASPNGRPRASRRQEIRDQVIAHALAELIPSIAKLPWGHVRRVIGCRLAIYSAERGEAQLDRPEWLPKVRCIVAECAAQHASKRHLADQLAAVTGKQVTRRVAKRAVDNCFAGIVRICGSLESATYRALLAKLLDATPAAVIEAVTR